MVYPTLRMPILIASALISFLIVAAAAVDFSRAETLPEIIDRTAIIDVHSYLMPSVIDVMAGTAVHMDGPLPQVQSHSDLSPSMSTESPADDLKESIVRFTERMEAEAEMPVVQLNTDTTTILEPLPLPMAAPMQVERIVDNAHDMVDVTALGGAVQVTAPSDAQVSVGSDPVTGTAILHVEGDNGTTHVQMNRESSVSVRTESSGGDASNSVSVRVSN